MAATASHSPQTPRNLEQDANGTDAVLRAQCSHGARQFLQRKHLDSLMSVQRAMPSLVDQGGSPSLQHPIRVQLVERLLILRVTVLASLYRPNQVASESLVMTTLQEKSRLSQREEDASIAIECIKILSLKPTAFIAHLWYSTLCAYQHYPIFPSEMSSAGLLHDRGSNQIRFTTETLPMALNPPAAVVAAVIMAALRIDVEVTKESPSRRSDARYRLMRSRKESNTQKDKHFSIDLPTTNNETEAGIESAKAICEWVLAAHSSPFCSSSCAAPLSKSQRAHLIDQHHRVLTLYALHILGSRQHHWEYANEVVRLAIPAVYDVASVRAEQDRDELLKRLGLARAYLETRGERRRAASEQIKVKLDIEKRRRESSHEVAEHIREQGELRAGASAQAQPELQGPERQGDARYEMTERSAIEKARKSTNKGRGRRPSSKRMSSTSGSSSTGSDDERGKKRPERSTQGEALLSNAPVAERQHVPTHAARVVMKDCQVESRSERPSSSLRRGEGGLKDHPETRVGMIRRLVRTNPLLLVRYVSAFIAIMLFLRRARISGKRASKFPPASTTSEFGTITAERLRRGRRPDQSFVSVLVSKILETLRMGTSITYL